MINTRFSMEIVFHIVQGSLILQKAVQGSYLINTSRSNQAFLFLYSHCPDLRVYLYMQVVMKVSI